MGNKKNLPPPEKKSKKSSSISEDAPSKPEKRRRSSETMSKSPSVPKAEKSSKRFRPDGIRDEVNPEEKQRIKDMARKMKEEAQNKQKPGGISSTFGKIPRKK